MLLEKRYKLWLICICILGIHYLQDNCILASSVDKVRIAGTDRYQTAIAISQEGWKTSDYAVLVRGDDFADGLSAGPLAHKYSAPVLITHSQRLDNSILKEIKRLEVKHLIIIGGFEAVSHEIEDYLKKGGIPVIERIYGTNRYHTSVKIAEKLDSTELAIVTGDVYYDALSIAAISSQRGMPILLTKKEELPAEVQDYISKTAVDRTYIIGGQGVIGTELDNHVPGPLRLAGNDRFKTNAIVINHFSKELSFNNIYVTRGDREFADALTGGVLAARTSSPLVFVHKNNFLSAIDALQTNFIKETRVIGLGGEQAVPTIVLQSITSYIDDSAAILKEKDDQSDIDSLHYDANPPSPALNEVTSVAGKIQDGYYKAGDSIIIAVTFHSDVVVTGTPLLHLATGGLGREAVYTGGSGTPVLTFEYTVQLGDTSIALDYGGTNSLILNGGTIKSACTNRDAIIVLAPPGEMGSLSQNSKIILDTEPPTAIDISLQNIIPNKGVLTLTVHGGPLSDTSWHDIFNHIRANTANGDHWITGITDTDLIMTLTDDGVTATISNTSDIDGIITRNFVIPVAKIVDRAGNTISEDMNIRSYVVAVTGVSSNMIDGYYKEGDVIEVTIHFSDSVDVSGTPLLQLATGGSGQEAVYKEGSGTSALTFEYIVQPGDTSDALDYLGIESLDLNGGSIKMVGSDEDVLLTLAVPGEIGSLSATQKIVIDTTAPHAINISSQNIIPPNGSVDLSVVGGPLSTSSWISILNQIKSNITNGNWIKGIMKDHLTITIATDGVSATLHNNNPTNQALIVKDFIISADRVVDRAGNVAVTDIRIDSYGGD